MILGPLILDIASTQLTSEDREILAHPLVGGVILFARNYHDPEQLANLTRDLRSIKNPSLLITVDQEGGTVQRFIQDFVKLPSLESIGQVYHDDPKQGLSLVKSAAWVMAQELLACGVDLSFAPVLDLKTPQSTVIGQRGRAFDADPENIVTLAEQYIQTLNSAGMQAVAKHFPGHGSAAGDSHDAIVRDSRPLKEMEAHDLIPFTKLIDQITGVMVAHVIYSEQDSQPAGFSRYWVTDYLRKKLKFSGLVFTDALDMQGATVYNSVSERVEQALAVGCDLALVCNNRKAAIEILDTLKYKIAENFSARIDKLRGRFDYDWKILHALPEWRMMVENLKSLEA